LANKENSVNSILGRTSIGSKLWIEKSDSIQSGSCKQGGAVWGMDALVDWVNSYLH